MGTQFLIEKGIPIDLVCKILKIYMQQYIAIKEEDPQLLKKHIEKMFAHKWKSSKLIGDTKSKVYKEIYKYVSEKQSNKELPYNGNYLGDNELAKNIYEKKYFLKDLNNKLIEKHPEDVFKRLASFLASTEGTKSKQKEWAEKFYTELFEGRFVSGGRVLAGAGDMYRIKTLANCFVSKIDKDDIDSIYKAAFECARTYSYGGGIGVDISSLRPKIFPNGGNEQLLLIFFSNSVEIKSSVS